METGFFLIVGRRRQRRPRRRGAGQARAGRVLRRAVAPGPPATGGVGRGRRADDLPGSARRGSSRSSSRPSPDRAGGSAKRSRAGCGPSRPTDLVEPDASDRLDLPTGTVTFLFTDIEGSTRLLQQLGDAYPDLLSEHHRLLREAVESGRRGSRRVGGRLALRRLRQRAGGGRRAAVAAQRALAASDTGRRARPSGCGWASTRARRSSATVPTSASTSTAPPGSRPSATAGRS